jgi:predicted small lipoprotein YifL
VAENKKTLGNRYICFSVNLVSASGLGVRILTILFTTVLLTMRNLRLTIVLSFILLALSGCGNKGPLKPPTSAFGEHYSTQLRSYTPARIASLKATFFREFPIEHQNA